MTAESLGWQLRSALPPMRLHSVSMYSNEADVLWLSEGALGPDEHNVVLEAIETLKGEKTKLYHELGMEDGRMAIFLGIRGPRGELVGAVMILADMKSVNENTMDRVLTQPVRSIMQKVAVYLRKTYPQSSSETNEFAAMPPAAVAQPAAAQNNSAGSPAIAPVAASSVASKAMPAQGDTLAAKEVEKLLTLELIDPPPVAQAKAPPVAAAAAAPAAPPAAPRPMTFIKGGAKAGASSALPAVGKAAPATATPVATRAKSSPPSAPAKASAATASIGAPVPVRDIEVLTFDPSIEVPAARLAAPVVLPEEDVLAFDASISIPTAHPAPAATPSVEIEVLDFDAELTIPPAPTAAAVTPSARAPEPRPAALEALARSRQAAPTVRAVENHRAATTSSQPRLDPRATFTGTSPIATTASIPIALPQAAKTPVKRDDGEEVLLINDTGPVKKLDVPAAEAAAVEPVPNLPPPPPLTAEETATDLALHVQELIKLRSSGRTRRYEVLARSHRDAGRNEVPTAFVSESAKGHEGAALDRIVVERLLQWLGQHGETIWDSEPASFSVNLSIGALEDETFPAQIAQWLATYNVPAEYVGFEISEFACVQCRPQVQRFVAACEKLGCFLVIDNFSFDSGVVEFLGSKAIRHVKIEPKLTTAAMKDKLPQALVVAILQACKVLGVHCVAKRVESQSSLQWLTAVGCDFAQSFHLEKPMPLDSLVSGKQIHALRE